MLPAPTASPRERLARLVRFGATGAVGFLIDFTLLIVLRSNLDVPLAVATIAAYATGCSVHYLLSRFWVFPHDADGAEIAKVMRYVLLATVNVVVTVVIVSGLTWLGLDYRVAKLIAVVTIFCSNYAIMPRFVMTVRRPGHTRP